jgi:hypothetical protein
MPRRKTAASPSNVITLPRKPIPITIGDIIDLADSIRPECVMSSGLHHARLAEEADRAGDREQALSQLIMAGCLLTREVFIVRATPKRRNYVVRRLAP